ncbi:MAG TPA: DUF4139 domain-containing protein [Gemmataceae bacterium]|nr:DUF4139 domain-containing protein [Gemmataceae bacterium]
MRRLLWIVPSAIAVALAGYLLSKPAVAPADINQPTPASSPQLPQAGHHVNKAETARLADSPELPVTKIVLYSSGVGFFQREGAINGDARVELSFPVQDINDLLKSLVLQDLDGGSVRAIGYDSHDPIAKTLDSFAIRLGDNPSYANILNQARGEKVEITCAASTPQTGEITASFTANTRVLQGTILGVETKLGAAKDSPVIEVLKLWSPDGIRAVPLAEAQRVKFLNPTVESEVNRALDVLARAHDTQKKGVSLQFHGKGTRSVKVGYVVETPLWRTSYRLLVGEDGKLFVQGWALVENPTNDDWKNVKMSLVSGRPISFKMDLYQPLYVPRPVVQPEIYGSVRPTIHGGGITIYGLSDGGESTAAGTAAGKPLATGGAFDRKITPPMTVEDGVQLLPGLPGKKAQIELDKARFGISFMPTDTATATDLGASFKYAIDQPITIPRQKSALLPIVNQELEGDKVSLYSPGAHAKYPLLAVRLKNTTGLNLMQGPVAVFEDADYCGDAQLPDIQPGEERLVSYALDLGTEVEAVNGEGTNQPGSIRLQKGLLTITSKVRESKTYTIKNRGTHDRVVLVEHPYRPAFRITSKEQPKERSRDVYRFEVKVAAGQTAKLEVEEEQDAGITHGLANYNYDFLLQCDLSNPEAKKAIQAVLDLQTKRTKLEGDQARLKKQLDDITSDQARLRANLKEMPETAAAYKRYLEKFDSQETVIEQLQTRIAEVRDRLQTHHEESQAYLNNLDIEATIRKSPPRK